MALVAEPHGNPEFPHQFWRRSDFCRCEKLGIIEMRTQKFQQKRWKFRKFQQKNQNFSTSKISTKKFDFDFFLSVHYYVISKTIIDSRVIWVFSPQLLSTMPLHLETQRLLGSTPFLLPASWVPPPSSARAEWSESVHRSFWARCQGGGRRNSWCR